MHDDVKAYYGNVLQHSDDLKTNACCTDIMIPDHIKRALANIHDEVLTRYYGCGLSIPSQLAGKRVLDLGCGAGRDCYVLSQLVGKSGYVLGVDMTTEQLAVAHKHQDFHQQQFGYEQGNTEFKQAYIEQLDTLALPDNSFDIIVSNCVINLSPDKDAVFREAYRLLKPGGELYFSDVYSDRRIPAELVDDNVLYGECLSGALYWNDFINKAKAAGFKDPRLVDDKPITIENQAVETLIGHINFYSATYRLFKLPELDSHCEDYGQAVIYLGTIEHAPEVFVLDKHHSIEKGKVFPVCGNTWQMLHDSRFQPHFQFIGDFEHHFGIFAGCGTDLPFATDNLQAEGGCC
jgi:arsenite methyltransferase